MTNANHRSVYPISIAQWMFFEFWQNKCRQAGKEAIIAGPGALSCVYRRTHKELLRQSTDIDIFTDLSCDPNYAIELLEHARREIGIYATLVRLSGYGEHNTNVYSRLFEVLYVMEISVMPKPKTSTRPLDAKNVRIVFTPRHVTNRPYARTILSSFDISICRCAFTSSRNSRKVLYYNDEVEEDIQNKTVRYYLQHEHKLCPESPRLKDYILQGFRLVGLTLYCGSFITLRGAYLSSESKTTTDILPCQTHS